MLSGQLKSRLAEASLTQASLLSHSLPDQKIETGGEMGDLCLCNSTINLVFLSLPIN